MYQISHSSSSVSGTSKRVNPSGAENWDVWRKFNLRLRKEVSLSSLIANLYGDNMLICLSLLSVSIQNSIDGNFTHWKEWFGQMNSLMGFLRLPLGITFLYPINSKYSTYLTQTNTHWKLSKKEEKRAQITLAFVSCFLSSKNTTTFSPFYTFYMFILVLFSKKK